MPTFWNNCLGGRQMRPVKAMRRRGLTIVLGLVVLAGCQQPNPNWANEAAIKIGAPRPDAAAIRAQQTVHLDGVAEKAVLLEATQVLQDLGFNPVNGIGKFWLLLLVAQEILVLVMELLLLEVLALAVLLENFHTKALEINILITQVLLTEQVTPQMTLLVLHMMRMQEASHSIKTIQAKVQLQAFLELSMRQLEVEAVQIHSMQSTSANVPSLTHPQLALLL